MLTGIARFAAQAPRLAAKRQVEYFALPARSVLNRVRAGLPFDWAINPYRGCEFGCKYCYARYTHEFLELDPVRGFEDRIFAKRGAAEVLRRELRRLPPGETIAIGTATDPYQPAERRYGATRALLEVFSSVRGYRLAITTKSDLIVRDAALLREVARANILHVRMTVTTMDDALARAMEPRAPRPDLRIAAVRELARAGIRVGVYASPVLPVLNDAEASLDAVARAAADAGAEAFGGHVVFLMPAALRVFLPFLAEHRPELVQRYEKRFQANAYLRGTYPEAIQRRVRRIRARYSLAGSPMEYAPDLSPPEQLVLFP